jgi:hypothetical protein
MARHILTLKQLQFLKDNAVGLYNKELAALFNEKFGTNLSWERIRAFKKYHHLKSGIDGKIKPGSEFWKLVKDDKKKANSTSYSKGHISVTERPIGFERTDGEGYILIKVAPRKWRIKSHVVWEKYYGKIPKGHAVIFVNGDKSNCDILNLILVSRRELGNLNGFGLTHRSSIELQYYSQRY